MTGFKITKKDGYYAYEAPGHKECKLTRLHVSFLQVAVQSTVQILSSPSTTLSRARCSLKVMTAVRPYLKKVTVYISHPEAKNA